MSRTSKVLVDPQPSCNDDRGYNLIPMPHHGVILRTTGYSSTSFGLPTCHLSLVSRSSWPGHSSTMCDQPSLGALQTNMTIHPCTFSHHNLSIKSLVLAATVSLHSDINCDRCPNLKTKLLLWTISPPNLHWEYFKLQMTFSYLLFVSQLLDCHPAIT